MKQINIITAGIVLLAVFVLKHQNILAFVPYSGQLLNFIAAIFLTVISVELMKNSGYFSIIRRIFLCAWIIYGIVSVYQLTGDYSPEKKIAYIAAVGSFVALGMMLLYFGRGEYSTRVMAHTGIMIAAAYVLSFLKVWQMPNGGSVSMAMIPIIVFSYMHSPRLGMTTGFLYGLVDLMLKPYIVHPFQIFLDYSLAFTALGVASFFRDSVKKFVFIGIPVGFFLRFLAHLISGAVFFSQYAPEGVNPWWYSAGYNATYLVPEMILCMIVGSRIVCSLKHQTEITG